MIELSTPVMFTYILPFGAREVNPTLLLCFRVHRIYAHEFCPIQNTIHD